MSTRHIAAETARLHDLTPEGSSGGASKRFRKKLAADGFTVDEGFRLKPGYLYTVVRAISARVNQNYDGWPSDELKKSYKTFIGKPCFVNHENHDPTKARGVVVASRYVENGMDKYVEVVQEIDAGRFPKLAHEIKTGGLDSVSMGAEAGFTICSYCHNKATDTHDMCDHVIHHKGKTLSRLDRKTGKREDVLVFESCHKISFFELSYVFEPADETAVASKVVVAGLRAAADDLAVPAPPGTPTIPQSVIDNTPVINLSPATELTGHEAPGVPKSSAFAADLAEITKLAGQCPPGADCNNMPDLNKELSQGGGASAANASVPTGGKPGEANDNRLLPGTQALNDALSERFPGTEIGGYREDPAYPDEHPAGKALDFMTSDIEVGNQALQTGWEGGADYAIWQNKMHYPDGSTKPYTGPNPHTDHVHFHHPGTAPAQRAAGKYTKDDFNHPSGMKPWEREKDSDAEDAAAIEIESMLLRTAMPFNPNTSHTQLGKSTMGTYVKAHDYLNSLKAPRGKTLDFGAGRGYSGLSPKDGGLGYHTFEPNPDKFVSKKGPTYNDCCDIPEASYKRLVSLNVLNVLDPHDEPGGRTHAVHEIGRILAPGGYALLTTRPDVTRGVSPDRFIGDEPGAVMMGPKGKERRQKGFTRSELHEYVSGVLGDGYTVSPAPNNIGGAGVMVVRNHDNIPRISARSDAVKKVARQRALRLAFGETEAPIAVDTLREEGSAPEDDNNDFERFVEPPADLQEPDLSEAGQIDRQQEEEGAPTDQVNGAPGPAGGGAPQQQFMTLQIPMPAGGPQIPQQAAPPQMPQPPMPEEDPAAQPPQQIAASLLNYFDDYYGRRVANWMDAIEARRDMNPAEVADYRRQAGKLSTLENGREHSTTNRNPTKGTAKMARNSIASRNKVATTGRRRHYAEGPLVDGGDRSRSDQGKQEEAFISQTPPEVAGDYVTGEHPGISNTEHSLVARVQQGRDQLLRDARQLAAMQQRRALTESGGPTAVVVNPTVNAGPGAEALTGTDFISADPNDGVVPTNPKDASLRAFQAFDGWLAQKTGKSSRRHTESNIKKAAAAFTREAGISPQMLFPALGIVLREARKNDKAKKGASMRKRSNESLEVAAPDGRIDVQAPVSGTTDAEAQASQFDLHDFGQNAGDSVAKPDLSTDQNWAPGEASGNKTSAVKTAGGLLAMRCAEGMIEAGLEPNSRERKYQLAAEFERMNRGLIQDRVALLERFASVRQADLRRVASGSSRGAARSPIPAGLGGGTRTAAAGMRTAANDPTNDSSLFI